MMNPFQHGVVVSGNDFCPRPELLRELCGHIEARQNCVIRGGRRMGKTSAVLEAIRSRRKAGCVLVNCWGKTSPAGLAEAIAEAFLAYQSRRGLSLKRILGGFAHLRPQATVDPQTGQPSFTVDLAGGRKFPPKSLEHVLDPIGEEGGRHPLVVVFDEFQALMRMEEHEAVIATLRGAIQLQPQVTYFYLGSVRNLMDALFNDPRQPFFKSAASVSVGPIERVSYSAYLREKFFTDRRRASDGALSMIFDMACDTTGDVQQLCSAIWNCTEAGQKIGEDDVRRGLARIHQTENESNTRIIDILTPGQVKVLVGLARVGGSQPTSKTFLQASGVSQPSSVTKAISRLEREGLIFRDPQGYQFFSPFFRTWLLSVGPSGSGSPGR
ncbi:MAG: hypothetical protein NTV93_00895 [Verrucomicrobia bacterium]|nr:hypothetical protein [Verrucomicrobiota bacterium]